MPGPASSSPKSRRYEVAWLRWRRSGLKQPRLLPGEHEIHLQELACLRVMPSGFHCDNPEA